ncbi:transmembrane protein 156 [Tenrec ecaudatus]|uniref:transmembrane protein 156 n=1 Tax=Tenrec ecaudatus TaxID=94439 RepID=UPI003F59BA7F
MTKTALLKLILAVVITIILILPDYFKTPGDNMLELSCLEMCLQTNLTYSQSLLNFSSMTLLRPVRETQVFRGIFLNHSDFQNVTRICQEILSEFKVCSSCLVCQSKEDMDFNSQEQSPKVLVMRGSMHSKASAFRLSRQHLNFTVAPVVGHAEAYHTTCNLQPHTRTPVPTVEEPTKEESTNDSCRTAGGLNSYVHVSLHLDMDIKYFTCSMKIAWYVLVLLVFVLLIILITHKILEGHRRVRTWPTHKCNSTSFLLRGSNSEKHTASNLKVLLVETTQSQPSAQVHVVLAPIPELEVVSTVHQ